MAKLSQKQLSLLRADFLQKRESILKKRVNSLQVKLFDKIFEEYLLSLEQSGGKLVDSSRNIDMIAGLNRIYKVFQDQFNTPIIKDWLNDMEEIHGLNVRYFESISKEGVMASKDIVKKAQNKVLGLEDDGSIKRGGFADKFIRDEKSLKQIKRFTTKAVIKGKSFIEFKNDLRKFVQGVDGSGGLLQRYYRNYAYDTYQKIDRINGLKFGEALELKYFIYQGGLIQTSRPFCIHYNGRILNSEDFSKLKKEDLSEDMRSGLPDDWEPLKDLGGYGCRHSIDWITSDVAERNKKKFDERADKNAQKFENDE